MDTKEIEKSIIERTITEIKSFATKIRAYCFANCAALTTADFPNATTIGDYAFSDCDALTTADFPNATTIGGYAFSDCDALTTADFPNATTIGDYAFYNCDALTDISFPLVTSIGGSAFSGAVANSLRIGEYSIPTIGNCIFHNPGNMVGTDATIGDCVIFVTSLNTYRYSDGLYINSCSVFAGMNGRLHLPVLTTIPSDSLNDLVLSELFIGNTLQQIASDAFSTYFAGINSPAAAPKSIHLLYSESDNVPQSVAESIGYLIVFGDSKHTRTNKFYTDNSVIKNALLSKTLNEYTTVTVKHLDGSDW